MPAPRTPSRRNPRRRGARRAPTTSQHNRAVWDRVSAGYDRRHAQALGGRHAAAWGVFRVPESELQLLGPIRGKRILELGCGAARWSIALAGQRARPTGLDLSSQQLARARELQRESGFRFPLVQGNAELLPFRDAAFDIVFCDWGAMTFSDPIRSVPECARVLRTGGYLVFATASPLRYVTLDVPSDRQVRRLLRPYFGSHRIDLGSDAAVEFNPPYGVWVDLFRGSGFVIERLIETRPPPGRPSTYLSREDAEWGRSWPLETIWKLRKE